jgi:hypothetical protein
LSNEQVFNKLKGKIAIAKHKGIQAAINRLLKVIPSMIFTRVKSGEGINGKLKPLAKSTISQRKTYSDNLDITTSPSESNATATGQMLNAIVGGKNNNGLSFKINDKKRKGELSGAKSKLTNNQVRKLYEDSGRDFFELTEEERKEANDIAVEIIKDELTRAIK